MRLSRLRYVYIFKTAELHMDHSYGHPGGHPTVHSNLLNELSRNIPTVCTKMVVLRRKRDLMNTFIVNHWYIPNQFVQMNKSTAISIL